VKSEQPSTLQTASYVAPLLLVVMFGGYLALGVLDGGGGVLWPDVIDAFGVSNGVFGVASGVGVAVVFPVMMFAAQIANRVDKRLILSGGFVAMMGAALIAIGGTGALLMTLLMLLRGLSIALIDLGNNAIAIDYQRSSNKHIMGPLHSMYSLGTLLGALVVWALFAAGGNFRSAYIAFGLIFTTMFVLSLLSMRGGTRIKGVRTAPIAFSITKGLLKRKEIILLGGISGLCIVGELIVTQWSGIYLRDERGFSESSRVITIAIYGMTMFLVRMFNGPIVNLLGPKRMLFIDGAFTALGGILIVSGLAQPVVLLGFVFSGLGLAGMIPLALSIAGVAAPLQSAAATGAVMVISYIGLAFGPILAGAVATIGNPQSVMLLEVLAGITAALFSLGLVTNHLQYDPDSESLAGELI
jgi:MFS family permease